VWTLIVTIWTSFVKKQAFFITGRTILCIKSLVASVLDKSEKVGEKND
jgi:hypothetical protein